MLPNYDIVDLVHRDYPLSPNLNVSAVEKLAELLRIQPDHIEITEMLVRTICSYEKNGWNWRNMIDQQYASQIRIKQISRNKYFIAYLRACFKDCVSQDDFKRMKGLIPEKFVELVYAKRYERIKKYKFNTGCNVIVNGNTIKYYPPGSSVSTRESMDVAAWDGYFGDFIEIKFSPFDFGKNEIGFMRSISYAMKNEKLKYYCKLYTWRDKLCLLLQLEKLGWTEDDACALVNSEILSLQTVEELEAIA